MASLSHHLGPVALLGIAGLLAACPPSSGQLIVDDDDDDGAPGDLDGDGDPAETDCDDSDPTAYNGNTETCGDGVDNDCDPETFCYEAIGGGATRYIDPFVTGGSSVAFYNQGGTQPFMASDSITVGLHLEEDSRALSLVFVVDEVNDGSGGYAILNVTGLGDAELLVEDDQGEGEVENGEGRFGFQWVECCVDGAVIAPLPRNLCVEFEVFESDGLSSFAVAGPGGQLGVGPIEGGLTLCASD